MINSQWLDLPISRIKFSGSKDVRAIDDLILYPLSEVAKNLRSICSSIIVLGPVAQSVVSLTSLLRVISLTVFADSIHNILIVFLLKKM